MLLNHLKFDARANCGPTGTVKALFAALFHPSVRACFLIRLCCSAPGPLYWIARNALIALHSIDVGRGAQIGPGLTLPHPMAIVIGKGVVIGKNARIYHGVTLGVIRGAYPTISDDVVLYPGSTVVGGITLGARSVVAAHAYVDEPVPEDTTLYASGARRVR